MTADALINKGVNILNPATDSGSRTIVVVGVARGGTSIVAGALHALGLPMGDKCYGPVYEDLRLSLAFESKSEEQFEDVVSEYNSVHSVWGWKRPSSISQLDMLQEKLRNPHFIVVFRDLFSIANRNSISMKSDMRQGLQDALDSYASVVGFLHRVESPVMLVSSDKVVRYKQAFLKGLSDFCGLEPTATQMDKASQFISTEPKDYMDKTRITKARGAVNIKFLKTGVLKGWARGIHHVNPVTVDVEVNGKIAASLEANIYREHLHKPNVHPTGECGYEMDLKQLGVMPKDVINVRVRDDVIPLNSQPIQFNDLDRWMTVKEWHAENQS
ncbi:hypothetical protein [Microbulbifer aggregans]|uniref:hypothetical protein n=1 Tax=Microbulbifer aggregans TaxID=1769779 RepID=UPI001CFCA229|nr:hypothetical protein [Microbulbifer aggregans]